MNIKDVSPELQPIPPPKQQPKKLNHKQKPEL